ncbi:MAG: hypothetical protein FWH06_03130 [Oscillospiraceae bacterium]|nr:hypothetical protein [Oscillospiraceae bacterium]
MLFRIKRLRKGILFLQKKGSGAVGLIIGGIILVTVTFMNNSVVSDETATVIVIGAILCAAGLILWWRSGLTKLYREKVRERSLRDYEKLIEEKDGQILRLQESNDFMAKLIHRDSKLLPAMYEVVKTFLENGDISNGMGILLRLEEQMSERTGAITRVQHENKILPSTEDSFVDGVMKRMMLKAAEEDIQFDITITGDISGLTETVIPSVKFQTLCADLIENAIIAASYSDYRRIHIMLGMSEGLYELDIQDTGIPFEIATLMDLGVKKASTHLDDGGSGIGYMTVFEILREFRASLIITEYEPTRYGFTKSVKVRFDGMREYTVRTYRDFPAARAAEAPAVSRVKL